MHLRAIVRSLGLVNPNEFSKQISAEWDIYLSKSFVDGTDILLNLKP